MSQSDPKKVVVIGGGTGMPVLLRGLKQQPIDLSAIVTVADDGGSSGRLRSEMEMPAPGDIRNVIAALSDVEPMLMELFQHRFTKGNGLSGHSMGNLLLAAMTSVTGDFYNGIKEISRVLNVKGNIYPIANQNMFLHAEYEDGEIVVGESNIPKANKRIKRVFLKPNPVLPLPEAVSAIQEADLVVIAPGSLYTSTLPNLIVPQIGEALRNTKAKVVYVCNVMTQAGETNHYTASDHVQAIMDHIGTGCLQSVIVHNKTIARDVQMVYAEENAEPVKYDLDKLREMGLEIIEEDIVKELNHSLRHDTDKVAKVLCSLM
ncbi:gluconeogenesis factor YvcK family protein [Gracilibacillus thailandensis]|uniref:Gluconeogenesis factor n=1 Tax=Gracilibacillus thailandensis TaxID=563735 RepID=A0A6N7QUI9_9BACI|nr:YvcK family protein [Gracilibacillus thailandensis]MRI65678.1 uridine diphosphate-N-acetylglucosamine-binding protein YvcK [Gracilibacillus thailandensis]